MSRLTAKDFQPEVLQLFDGYVHGQISRRSFLDSVSRHAGSSAAAVGILTALSPNFAAAQVVATTDPRIVGQFVEFDTSIGSGHVRGYLVRPASAPSGARLPTVLVAHENRGLNPHIEDIARRLALHGFLAFAPDVLDPLGGYPGNEDQAREMFAKLDTANARADFVASAQWLKASPLSNGKLGVLGFCWGGGVANYLATQMPDLCAAVPFYGPQPPAQEVEKIKSPLLIHYAGVDERINAGWPAYEAALKAAGVRYEAHIYPGVQHGFNNNTTPRFDADAAGLAWERTVNFLHQNLK